MKYKTMQILLTAIFVLMTMICGGNTTTHVYAVREIAFHTDKIYDNPYMGDKTGDSGLDHKNGSFHAAAWTDAEKTANPNRHGFIKTSDNGHTLEYADGFPFFYTGDTWWCALTKIYSRGSAEGESEISFQDALALRKAQGFNGINMIACFPSDTLHSLFMGTLWLLQHDLQLVPAMETHLAKPDGEFLALALAPDKRLGLGFVSANKESCDINKLTPNTDYRIEWWHIDDGGWRQEMVHKTDDSGRLAMPGVPEGKKRGWAFRIMRVD